VVKRRPVSRALDEAEQPAGGVLFRYIETSGLVAALLDEDRNARLAIMGEGLRFASALTFAEAARALLKARLDGRLTVDEERALLRRLRRFERSCEIADISESVLARAARPFAVEPVRTLDAIHLATVEQLGETPQFVAVVSRDRRVRENALAMGYAVE
jgi:predicted nucleic acid-binding protein